MDGHPLLRSLLATTVASPPPKSVYPNIITNISSIIARVILILFIGIIAIWANHEASKGFSVTIVNDAGKYSLARKRFSLLYESNDKATRIVVNTSRFVENVLYPNQQFLHTKKQIDGITLRLAPTNFPAVVSVDLQKPHVYLISLSPSLMETANNNEAIVLAVLQGMARVWLWNGNGAVPPVILNGMVEYISSLAGFTVIESGEMCWKDKDPKKVAGLLRYCDERSGGGEVIRRLNQRMRNGWDDTMMDHGLGMPSQHACASYDRMMRDHHQSS